MTPVEAIAAALDAEARWRHLQLEGIDGLCFSPDAVAERHFAEGLLRSALLDLGAAIMRFSRVPQQRTSLLRALAGPTEPMAGMEAEGPGATAEGPDGAAEGPEPTVDLQADPEGDPQPDPVTVVVAVAPLPAEPPGPTPPSPSPTPAKRPTLYNAPVTHPAPSPTPAPPSAAVTVTAALLKNLTREMTTGRDLAPSPHAASSAADRRLADAVPFLRAALASFGEPPGPSASTGQLSAEGVRLSDIASSGVPEWGSLPDRANLVLTGWLTARCRHLQEISDRVGCGPVEAQMGAAIRRLAAHSKQSRPGFVHGLALHHAPQLGDWAVDAAHWRTLVQELVQEADSAAQSGRRSNHDDAIRVLTERSRSGVEPRALVEEVKALVKAGLSPTDKRLVNVARPYVDSLDGSALTPLRKAIRDAVEAESEAEDDDARSCVPMDWPHLSETRGRVAVIVGGEPRKERLERLKSAFEFGAVEWVEGSTVRKIDSLQQRMLSGTVQIVIVLRAFNSHKVSDAIFSVNSQSCVAVLADGYGLTQIQLGFERFLGRSE